MKTKSAGKSMTGRPHDTLAHRIRKVVAKSYPAVEFADVSRRLRLPKEARHPGSHAENVYREAVASVRVLAEVGRLKGASQSAAR